MPNGSQKKTRIQRVASLEMPPSPFERLVASFQRAEVLWRIGLCVAGAMAVWAIVGGWKPPFAYRRDYTPPRNIVAKVSFQINDEKATREAKDKAARQIRYVYTQDPAPLIQYRVGPQERGRRDRRRRQILRSAGRCLERILAARRWRTSIRRRRKIRKRSLPSSTPSSIRRRSERHSRRRSIEPSAISSRRASSKSSIRNRIKGSQTEIEVHPVTSNWASPVPVAEVRSGDAIARASQSTQDRAGRSRDRPARILLDQAEARKAHAR